MIFRNFVSVINDHSLLFMLTFGAYIVCVILGFMLRNFEPLIKFIHAADEQKIKQTEKIFGKYRESVKNGNIITMIQCSGIVFGMNTLAAIQNIILSAFIVPLVLTLVFVGVCQGVAFSETKGSSLFSVVSYYFVGGLEWLTYPLSIFAGLIIPATIFSAIVKHTNIIAGLSIAMYQIFYVFVIIVVLLIIQAPLELLYVRKVLQKGGSGIPLKPY